MKKTLLIIGAIAVVAYFIISITKGIWNPLKWFAADPPAGGSNTNTPTDPNTYPGGFKWDATEKKCYGIFSDGNVAWVGNDECTSRGIPTT